MQYLGSKARLAPWIVESVRTRFPESRWFIDVFAGTGVVGLEAAQRGYKIVANDIQPYSAAVLRSLFTTDRSDIAHVIDRLQTLDEQDLLGSGRGSAASLLKTESVYFADLRSETLDWRQYRDFCESTPLFSGSEQEAQKLREQADWNLFTHYYANTYFGVRQCLELDALREYAAELPEKLRVHLLAATVSVMTYAVSSTTHLAQYLRPSSESRARRLLTRRRKSLIGGTIDRLRALTNTPTYDPAHRVEQTEAIDVARAAGSTSVIYADPPYFKEHYSRYYHVLDTFVLYDYPALTFNSRTNRTTEGRYRDSRYVSAFGLKSAVEDAFTKLFAACAEGGSPAAVSYADTSLVEIEVLRDLAESSGYSVEILRMPLLHSGQGQPRGKTVTEHLFLMSYQKGEN